MVKLSNIRNFRLVYSSRDGHGSVWAGFGPFGHPTRAHWVWEFPTCDSKENVETQWVFGQFGSGFLVGLVELVGRVRYF